MQLSRPKEVYPTTVIIMGNRQSANVRVINVESQKTEPKGVKKVKVSEHIKKSRRKAVDDVMISYSHKDTKMMEKVLEYLKENGHTVWTDRELQGGQEFLNTIGQAVLESRVFLPILSENYTSSHVCRDEQALAYLSGKPITPLALGPQEQLEPHMDLGMRLQMARFPWHVISEDNFRATMSDFLLTLRRCLEEVTQTGSDITEEVGDADFWKRHFGETPSVSFESFCETFFLEYEQRIVTFYGSGMETRLRDILARELDAAINDNKVLKGVYVEFCKLAGTPVSLWTRLKDQVAEDLAGWEVLEMDSSVRVDFIEYLGKVQSRRAVEILLDLLESGDGDMKATAALSLSKIGDSSDRVIKKLLMCLESEDRLVRESGCLALGNLRAKEAVPKLIQLWRNDVISHVREACELSLRLVGREAAEKAIYVTNLLSREIRDLTQDVDRH